MSEKQEINPELLAALARIEQEAAKFAEACRKVKVPQVILDLKNIDPLLVRNPSSDKGDIRA